MSPRLIPKHERGLWGPTPTGTMAGEIPVGSGGGDGDAVGRYVQADALQRQGKCTAATPYSPTCNHSFFADLLLVEQERSRKDAAVESPILRGRDQGAEDFSDKDLSAAKDRLRTAYWIKDRAQRDLSVSSANDMMRPSLPGYLLSIWGRAARATGSLAAALETHPLEAGMIDTSSNVPTVSIPRLSGGAGVAVQASQNLAVQETDPTSVSMSSPVSTIAGQVDLSRQLFEFSRSIDAAVVDDLARATAQTLDVELVNGTATSGRTRGLLSWTGILSITGAVTNAQTFLNSVWQAYSALAGSSGYGDSNTDDYITVLHPRRAAWLAAGVSGTLPPGTPLVPGQLVISAGVPSNLGAGTNEDVALVVARDQVVLLDTGPRIVVREDVGSQTLTVRISAVRDAALLVKNATAVAKVTGLVAPSGF